MKRVRPSVIWVRMMADVRLALVVSSADWMKVAITGERFCGCTCTATWSLVQTCSVKNAQWSKCRLPKRAISDSVRRSRPERICAQARRRGVMGETGNRFIAFVPELGEPAC